MSQSAGMSGVVQLPKPLGKHRGPVDSLVPCAVEQSAWQVPGVWFRVQILNPKSYLTKACRNLCLPNCSQSAYTCLSMGLHSLMSFVLKDSLSFEAQQHSFLHRVTGLRGCNRRLLFHTQLKSLRLNQTHSKCGCSLQINVRV